MRKRVITLSAPAVDNALEATSELLDTLSDDPDGRAQ